MRRWILSAHKKLICIISKVKTKLDLMLSFTFVSDDTNTLLKVRNELNLYLKEINFIYHVHSTSLDSDWRTEPASKVASKYVVKSN